MRSTTLFLTVAFLALAPGLTLAADATSKSFSDQEKAGIEAIIKQYLTKEHPEVLMEAAQEYERRQNTASNTKSEAAIGQESDKLFNNPDTPVSPGKDPDVTVVEFFDYQCGYCKLAEDGVEKLLKQDPKVKFIYEEYPILGPASTVAAKASLASVRQGKYIAFHNALMSLKDHLTEDEIYSTAKTAGLDVDQLKKDMNDSKINDMIAKNIDLGTTIGVRGTPMFIVGKHIYPGAMQYDQLKKAVDDSRAEKKS